MMHNKTALITGAARRVGASIARTLHQKGYDLLLHYNHSQADAEAVQQELNSVRPNSVSLIQCDLQEMAAVEKMTATILSNTPQLSLLINNASSFFPTPVEESSQQQWDNLINSNLRAPYFLTVGLNPLLQRNRGCVVNLIDIHAQRGLPGYPIYSIAKAGLQMMTMSLAKELAPKVRVNGVSPGPILWPEAEATLGEKEKQAIIDKTLLKRSGSAEDLAQAVFYFSEAEFVTGQILSVDGGKSLYSH